MDITMSDNYYEEVVNMSKKKERVSVALKTRDLLEKKANEFQGKLDVLGMGMLTFPVHMSGPRTVMCTGNLSQFNNIHRPEVPKVATNAENMVGKYSTGYYQASADLEVFAIIPRYGNDKKHLYDVIVYDTEKEQYDLISKKTMEVLVEGFTFGYNTEALDKLIEGDTIKKGEILFKSESYDEYMNYRYGTNITYSYFIDNDTIEDAVVLSESGRDKIVSTLAETVEVSINDNDILVNLYGERGEYKGFPDIGEPIKDSVVCARRRIQESQLLGSMKQANLKVANTTSDRLLYCEGVVEDIFIYANKTLDEIPDNMFNKQIRHYIEQQNIYFGKIKEICDGIKERGETYSAELSYLHDKANKVLDPDVQWRDDKGSVFSNIRMKITVTRESLAAPGQKLAGRYGNKGVVSKVLPDDQMPFTDTGKRIDIMFNVLGVINRLNTQQLFELSITSIMNQTSRRMIELDSQQEREELAIRMINYFNEEQASKVKEFLETCTTEEYIEFFDDFMNERTVIHIPPLWHEKPLFERVRDAYNDNSWITLSDLYVKRFGRTIKILNKFTVGEMYIMKLKQTSEYGLSARSTGSVSRKGLPEKTRRLQEHKDPYSKTPIRKGIDENNNMFIGLDSRVNAVWDLLYRSSVLGRQALPTMLIKSDKPIVTVPVTEEFTNRNIEMFNAWSMVLGLKLTFKDNLRTVAILREQKYDHELSDGRIFHGTDEEFLIEQIRPKVEQQMRDDAMKYRHIDVMSVEEYERTVNTLCQLELQRRYSH